MITIISATNRPDSQSLKLANYCQNYLLAKEIEAQLFNLEDLPTSFLHPYMYEEDGQDQQLSKIQDEFIFKADKMLFIIPEYNGGIPGILKLFIDGLLARNYDENFKNKKACLIGISSGRAGNLRGLDYFTNVLNYVKMDVFRMKLPVSSIEDHMDSKGLLDEETSSAMVDLLDAFMKY